MLERVERALKVLCVGLAAVLIAQSARWVASSNPLGRVAMPALPTWPPQGAPHAGPGPTNAASPPAASSAGTSPASSAISPAGIPAGMAAGVHGRVEGVMTGPPGAVFPPGAAMGRPNLADPFALSNLPPAIRTRVDRILKSELLGPILRPPPTALLGIAGKDVFLRGPNGQTGLVHEGDTLGGVKLLRVGTNRVLVEESGQDKELMIFGGFGGESLLPKSEGSLR